MAIVTPAQVSRRILEVRIGPPSGQGLRFRGDVDGAPGLHITCKAAHTSGSRPSKSQIKIFNLSEESIHQIERKGSVVEVLAGQDLLARLFRGDVTRVQTKNDTETRETAIEAADGQRVYSETTLVRSWPHNVRRSQIFQDCLNAMGVVRGYISPAIPDRVYASGFMWASGVRELLDVIWDSDKGERWTLVDGACDVLKESDTKPGNVVVLRSDTGLIGSPSRTKKGCKFKAWFDPRIRPNHGVQIDSQFLKGLFRVVKADHDLESKGLTWFTTGEAVKA